MGTPANGTLQNASDVVSVAVQGGCYIQAQGSVGSGTIVFEMLCPDGIAWDSVAVNRLDSEAQENSRSWTGTTSVVQGWIFNAPFPTTLRVRCTSGLAGVMSIWLLPQLGI